MSTAVKILLTIVVCISAFKSYAQPELLTNLGHTDDIKDIKVSPNGKFFISGGIDQEVVLWHLPSGKEMRRFKGHETAITALAYDPYGKWVVSGGQDGLLMVWDVASGSMLKYLEGHTGTIRGADFSPDGGWLATGSDDQTIRIWNIQTGDQLLSIVGHGDLVTDVKFSTDGLHLISSSLDNSIRIWYAETGELVRTLRSLDVGQFLGTEEVGIAAIDVSNDGKMIASAHYDGSVKIWNPNDGKVIQNLKGHEHGCLSLAFTPEARYLISGGKDNKAIVWDLYSGEAVRSLHHGSNVNVLTFVPNGQSVLVGGELPDIRLWSYQTNETIKQYSSTARAESLIPLAVAKIGKQFISGNVGQFAKSWNIGTSAQYADIAVDYIRATAYSPDGKFLATLNSNVGSRYLNTLKLWDSHSGEVVRTYGNPFLDANLYSELPLIFSPNGKYLISTSNTSHINIYNTDEKSVWKQLDHTANSSVYSLAMTSDGSQLASAGGGTFDIERGNIMLWDFDSQTEIRTYKGHTSGISSLVFAPDNRSLFSASFDNTIKQWATDADRLIRTYEGHQMLIKEQYDEVGVTCLDISPDGKTLVSGGIDHTVILWDVTTGIIKKRIEAHQDAVLKVKFSADGLYIFSQSHDRTVKIWSSQSGSLIATLMEFNTDNHDWVIFTPDGRFDGSEGGYNRMQLVDGMKVIPMESYFEKLYTPNLLSEMLDASQLPDTDINLDDMLMPPDVVILTPDHNSEHDQKQVTVTVKAEDLGGGVGEIRLYHNGKLVESAQRGFKKADHMKSFEIMLTAGENLIRATAFSNQHIEGIPHEIKVQFGGARKTSNLHMLIVAINQYQNKEYNLNYAIADADAITNAIQKPAGQIFNQVFLTRLSDAEVTRAGLLQAFEDMISDAKEEDVFVFYYAGHGVMSEENQSKYYLIPHNITQLYGDNDQLKIHAVSGEDIRDFSTRLKAQKQLFILDACQSGGITEMLASRGSSQEKAIAQLARSTGTYWLTASGSQQFATEFAQLGHGLFTYALLRALAGEADGGTKDGKITVGEIGAFLNDKVPELSEQYKGTAQYPNSYGYGQDFPILVIDNAVPIAEETLIFDE